MGGSSNWAPHGRSFLSSGGARLGSSGGGGDVFRTEPSWGRTEEQSEVAGTMDTGELGISRAPGGPGEGRSLSPRPAPFKGILSSSSAPPIRDRKETMQEPVPRTSRPSLDLSKMLHEGDAYQRALESQTE